MGLFLSWKKLGRYFDHVLGNHFWAMSACHIINKMYYLNTWLLSSLELTFSSQNHYQNFSQRMACLGPCPSGKEGEKVACPKGKSTCPGRPDGVFFEPCLDINYSSRFIQNLHYPIACCLPHLSTVAHNCHSKGINLTAKRKTSWQKE